MSALNARFAESIEVRCNFCLNWISGQQLSKKNLHTCDSCLQKHILHGFEVYTATGDVHRLQIFKENDGRDICSKSFIDNLSELRSHHDQSERLEDCNEVIEEKYLS